jgi:hypothetical protein
MTLSRAAWLRRGVLLAVVVLVGAWIAVRALSRHGRSSAGEGTSPTVATGYQPAGPRPAYLASLSDAEFRFGVSPTRNKDVEYQDSVIIMEHGADAIRSYSSNGMTWTFDATAPQVDQIKQGRIVFATSRAVGQVLGVQRTGNLVAVTFGPVAITDVIKKVDMEFDQPLDFSQAVAYVASDYPGAVANVDSAAPRGDSASHSGDSSASAPAKPAVRRAGPQIQAGRATLRLAGWARSRVRVPADATVAQDPFSGGGPAAQAINALGPIFGIPGAVNIGDFNVTPFCCGGLGVRAVRSAADLQVIAEASLQLRSPAIHFYLKIDGGTVRRAGVELKGAAGLVVKFSAGSTSGLAGNINKTFSVPVDLCFPIVGKAVPVVATVRQTFLIHTGFSAKNSTLNVNGDYEFAGSVFMGVQDGSWTISAPTKLNVRQSLMNSISGASIGANAIIFGYGARVIVGIGAFGFATGPFLSYDTVVGATRGSDIAFPCRTGILRLSMRAGIGYQIAQPVTRVINFFLRTFNLREISGSGGIGHEEKLVSHVESVPHNCGPSE